MRGWAGRAWQMEVRGLGRARPARSGTAQSLSDRFLRCLARNIPVNYMAHHEQSHDVKAAVDSQLIQRRLAREGKVILAGLPSLEVPMLWSVAAPIAGLCWTAPSWALPLGSCCPGAALAQHIVHVP